jgi:PAS domain S-box-containing protein
MRKRDAGTVADASRADRRQGACATPSLVSSLAEAWADSADPESALRSVLAAVLQTRRVSKGALYLQRGGGLELVASRGLTEADRARLTTLAATTELRRLLFPGGPEAVATGELRRATGSAAAVAVPLVSGGDRLGVLLLASERPRARRRRWIALARAAGIEAGHAVALEEARLRLQLSERRNQALFEHARDGIFLLTPDGVIRDVNRSGEALLGQPRVEIVGRHFTEFNVPDQAPVEAARFPRLAETGTLLAENVVLRRPNGSRVVVDFSTRLVEAAGERVAISIAHDVTARRQAEEEVRLLQTITLAATGADDIEGTLQVVLGEVGRVTGWTFGDAWVPRADGAAIDCVTAWTDADSDRERFRRFTTGWTFGSGEGLAGRAWQTRNPVWIRHMCEDAALPRRSVAAELELGAGMAIPVLAGEEVVAVLEFFTRAPHELDAHLLDLVSAVASQIGSFVRRKRAEEALRAARQQLRLILDSTAEAIYGIDLQGNCTFANVACLRMLGYREERDVVGKNMHCLMHHTRADGTRYPVTECIIYAAGLRGDGACSEDDVLWRADGTSFPAEIRSVPLLRDGVRVGAVVSFVDITERKQAAEALRKTEERLRNAAKMEAVGQLAGGIAHDFNNILAVILTDCSLLLERIEEGNPFREDIVEIRECSERGAALTRQVLAISRNQVLVQEVIDLNDVAERMGKLLRRVIGGDVELVTSLARPLGAIKADVGQLEQVILNLAVNARDAMPGGGRLTIETSHVELDSSDAPSPQTNRYVLLAVTDTGHGMDAATQSRIFEPFFTTKERGKGTGLGLSTVYGIVRQSGGAIRVYSEPGRGTSFKVYLPIIDDSRCETRIRQTPTRLDGSETILVVDDDVLVRSVARKALESKGYTVLQAATGQEALEMCSRDPQAVDLVVSDVVIPGINGVQLTRLIRERHPNIRVLLMSGYAERAVVGEAPADGLLFLSKPFTSERLARKVREAIEA